MYWWRRFDPSVVKRDFSLLGEYGFEVVRIFLLWEDFQPEMRRVSVRALNHLVEVAEMAHGSHLQILPTFFTGHMSGLNWLPPWMLDSESRADHFPVFSRGEMRSVGVRNMYSDRGVWKAQRLLLRETTGALQGHPAIWGWDMGNEPSRVGLPPSRDAAWAWLEEMVIELKRYDSDIPVTLGLHQEDLEEDRRLGPRDAARFCDILSIHTYPGHATWSDGPRDRVVPLFLALLTAWLGGREVLLGAFGISTDPGGRMLCEADRLKLQDVEMASEEDGAVYYRGVLELLISAGIPGAFVWCFSDYEPVLWGMPPFDRHLHERYCGLFRWDGSPKEAVKWVAVADRWIPKRELGFDWIDIQPEEYWECPMDHLKRLYSRFRAYFEEEWRE